MAEMVDSTEIEKEKQLASEIDKSAFSEQIYKELARINGRINQMSQHAIIIKLKQLGLSPEGSCEILKKRLKNFYKRQKLSRANLQAVSKLFPFYVIVDFEATCEAVNPLHYPHEIIEFPAVLVETEKQAIVDQFQAYCKPVLNPTLSQFCKELTGITQEQIENARPFNEVLSDFESWLSKHRLGSKNKYALVTDGPWDMSRFLFGQCKISNISYPQFGKKWINIRKSYSSFYKSQRISLSNMLSRLQIEFEGRPHCGLDDAFNIARILLRMVSDGASLQVNERINLNPSEDKSLHRSHKDSQRMSQISARVIPVHNDDSRNYMRCCRERNMRQQHFKSKLNVDGSSVNEEDRANENQAYQSQVSVSDERTESEQVKTEVKFSVDESSGTRDAAA